MPKNLTELRSLARTHTGRAIAVLAGIMDQPASSEMARIAAANALLDRGWGKAKETTEHTGEEGGPIKIEYSWAANKAQAVQDPSAA